MGEKLPRMLGSKGDGYSFMVFLEVQLFSILGGFQDTVE